MPALKGPHLSLALGSLPSASTAHQPALLMMHMGILGQRGRVTQLTASQVLPQVRCTCSPLPVTAPPRAFEGNQSRNSDLHFCKVVNPPSGFCAGSFYCTSYIPQSWHMHPFPRPPRTVGPGYWVLSGMGPGATSTWLRVGSKQS